MLTCVCVSLSELFPSHKDEPLTAAAASCTPGRQRTRGRSLSGRDEPAVEVERRKPVCDGAVSSEASPRCPGGTPPSAEDPGDPSADVFPDLEAHQGNAGGPSEEGAAGVFKEPSRCLWRDPLATEEDVGSPAEAIPEERCQLKPREAGNQEEVRIKYGHALESVATPGTGGRGQ
ncbi:hypothetical protein NDU88_004060 [Pleurodeles waltl]|uniref:Uncharacterized protein n=1 Tax=Pleurodeles waltl TaxID=8319 RepID=A0AAV7V2H7_PLEWA|nr:hypothetical protein NDU88_004060 [Pleurodeles waltl]